MIDVFTTVPMVMSDWIGSGWLSFQYLRMYLVLTTYEELEQYGVLDNLTFSTRRLIISLLRTINLIFCCAGTIFVLEVSEPMRAW